MSHSFDLHGISVRVVGGRNFVVMNTERDEMNLRVIVRLGIVFGELYLWIIKCRQTD